MFTNFAQKNKIHFSWAEMVENADKYSNKVCVVKYENLFKDPVSELEKSLNYYNVKVTDHSLIPAIIEKYSFKNVTKRKPGQEDRKSFVRKGISGDWKNYFTEEACEVFKKYGGEALIVAGYESNNSWTNTNNNK